MFRTDPERIGNRKFPEIAGTQLYVTIAPDFIDANPVVPAVRVCRSRQRGQNGAEQAG